MVIIKERMKNLVDNIPHAVSVEHKPVSAIDMLDIIESTFQNCQTEIERFVFSCVTVIFNIPKIVGKKLFLFLLVKQENCIKDRSCKLCLVIKIVQNV